MIICIYIFVCFHSVFFLFVSLVLPCTHNESAVPNVQRNLKRVIKMGEKQLPCFFFPTSRLQGLRKLSCRLPSCVAGRMPR